VDERPVVHISDGVSGEMTRSKTHEGFLSDPFTMNSLLTIILDGAPRRRFRAEELDF
jgi:hypothetical protein